MPVEEPTIAVPVEPLAHVPPGVVLLSVILLPTHTIVGPVIAPGFGFTVMIATELQPFVYVTVHVPAVRPNTTPDGSTVMPAHDVDHVPPTGVPDNVVDVPTQVESVPDIVGAAFTVTIIVLKQPVLGMAYVIIAVPPLTPKIIPVVEPTLTLPLVELQVTPGVVLLNVVLLPTHIARVPVATAGNGLIETTVVVKHPVGPVIVTVAVPSATPVTIPVVEPITTEPVPAVVDHVPPDGVLESVIFAPTQTLEGPAIAPGAALTDTTEVVKQPPGNI
jgi:hypothetical protein